MQTIMHFRNRDDMILLLIASLHLVAYAQFDEAEPVDPVERPSRETINGTLEYDSFCRTCPYNICTHTFVPRNDEAYELTCWANGDVVGDTDLWLRTTEGCYIPEYDLIEYEGDFSAELESCGEIPLDVTQERARVKYLSVCKWGYATSAESIAYYGRDVDITVTCWAEGSGEIMGNPYWYRTLDYCWVSGSGLWHKPDHNALQPCGPIFGPRINESMEPLPTDGAKPTPLPKNEEDEEDEEDEDGDDSLVRRWLEPGKIGEEYSGCYSCPNSVRNETCHLVTVYEFNQTIISQCVDTISLPRGPWVYTTDWCYVNGTEFWEPPWDHYRYPACSYWDL